MSLLIAFAASTAAASISGSTVANVLARERGIEVPEDSIRLQLTDIDCGTMHITSVRGIGRDLEVVFRCGERKLPLLAVVKDSKAPGKRSVIPSLNDVIPVIVRRGTMVRLLISSDKVRMTLPAVCLESGSLGKTVRVRIPGTHAIRIARVTSAGVVVEEGV